jgi:hypothetical protein
MSVMLTDVKQEPEEDWGGLGVKIEEGVLKSEGVELFSQDPLGPPLGNDIIKVEGVAINRKSPLSWSTMLNSPAPTHLHRRRRHSHVELPC